MAARTAYIYSEEYFRYDYGAHHPMRIERLKLCHQLIKACGLLDAEDMLIMETLPAAAEELGRVHRPEYLDLLRRAGLGTCDLSDAGPYGLGPGDNPIFTGLWEWSLLTTGASLMAGRIVSSGRVDTAFNMAGGLHHAGASRASGFCYINDIAVMISELVDKGLRVAYVDVDAHHGDGVERIFYDTDRVLTVSIHQHGRTLFPGSGYVYDTGAGRGAGFAVNLPLYPGSDDELFLQVFMELVPELVAAYRPDILVTQLGVDTFRTDPLTNLCLTTNGFEAAVRAFKALDLPWVALGGGGYHIVNVARAWTLAWAVMNDLEPPEDLPPEFIELIRPLGYREARLRDTHYRTEGEFRAEAESVARQVIDSIRRTALPALKKSC